MIRNFLAKLCTLTFIILYVLFTFIGHITYRYLSEDFYAQHVESTIKPFIAYTITKVIFNKTPELKNYLLEKEVEIEIQKELITTQFLQDTIKSVFLQLSFYQQNQDIRLSLAPVKENGLMFSEKLVAKITDKLEPCTMEELRDMKRIQENIPSCIPESMSKAEFSKTLTKFLSDHTIDYIPSEIKLSSPDISPFIINIHYYIKYRYFILITMVSVLMLLLFLIGLLVAQSWKRVFKWEAVALLLGSLYVLIIATLLKYGSQKIIENIKIFPVARIDLFNNFLNIALWDFYISALCFMIIGILFLSAYFLTKPSHE